MDGAYFGPALPHLFLMVYPEFLPKKKYEMLQTSIRKYEARKTGKEHVEDDSEPTSDENYPSMTDEKKKEL